MDLRVSPILLSYVDIESERLFLLYSSSTGMKLVIGMPKMVSWSSAIQTEATVQSLKAVLCGSRIAKRLAVVGSTYSTWEGWDIDDPQRTVLKTPFAPLNESLITCNSASALVEMVGPLANDYFQKAHQALPYGPPSVFE